MLLPQAPRTAPRTTTAAAAEALRTAPGPTTAIAGLDDGLGPDGIDLSHFRATHASAIPTTFLLLTLALGGRPPREGRRRRRRGALGRSGPGGAWPWGGDGDTVSNIGRNNLLKYKENTEMRETRKKQNTTCSGFA